MRRSRAPQAPKVVYRTARAGLRVTRGQRRRLVGLLVSAGDVWACMLDLNAWRRALMPVRWYHGTFTLQGKRLRLPVARGRPPLWVRLDRDLPYLADQVCSVTLRTRDWRIGHLIAALKDKAEAAGIGLALLDERGTSICPACRSRIPKPAGRVLACPACQFTGHRDLSAATKISPPGMAAGPRRPSRPASRTAAPGRTCLVSPPRDVTHAAAPITAALAGPLAGIGPPASVGRESLATWREACSLHP